MRSLYSGLPPVHVGGRKLQAVLDNRETPAVCLLERDGGLLDSQRLAPEQKPLITLLDDQGLRFLERKLV